MPRPGRGRGEGGVPGGDETGEVEGVVEEAEEGRCPEVVGVEAAVEARVGDEAAPVLADEGEAGQTGRVRREAVEDLEQEGEVEDGLGGGWRGLLREGRGAQEGVWPALEGGQSTPEGRSGSRPSWPEGRVRPRGPEAAHQGPARKSLSREQEETRTRRRRVFGVSRWDVRASGVPRWHFAGNNVQLQRVFLLCRLGFSREYVRRPLLFASSFLRQLFARSGIL